jgi:hypothetical protein
MRATIIVRDENGVEYHGEVDLAVAGGSSPSSSQIPVLNRTSELNLTLPLRAFMKKYGTGKSGGAAKFTVLLAYIAQGREDVDVQSSEIERAWKRLTAHLGAFNRAHPTRAKDRGWVDSKQTGSYRLGPLWRQVFSLGG